MEYCDSYTQANFLSQAHIAMSQFFWLKALLVLEYPSSEPVSLGGFHRRFSGLSRTCFSEYRGKSFIF